MKVTGEKLLHEKFCVGCFCFARCSVYLSHGLSYLFSSFMKIGTFNIILTSFLLLFLSFFFLRFLLPLLHLLFYFLHGHLCNHYLHERFPDFTLTMTARHNDPQPRNRRHDDSQSRGPTHDDPRDDDTNQAKAIIYVYSVTMGCMSY